MPAPPLRTLATRPGNERTITSSPIPTADEVVEISSPKDRAARNIKPINQSHSGIGQFKLASIDQMGGLSSLMMESPPRTNGIAFGDTQQHITTTIINNLNNNNNNNNISLNKDEIHDSQVVAVAAAVKKRKIDDVTMDMYDEELTGKSRACKGKRYEQFMTPTKKATKQKSTNASATTTSSSMITAIVHFPHNGYCKQPQELSSTNAKASHAHHHNNNSTTIGRSHDVDSSDEMMLHSPESDEVNEARNADANDFKLNDKIMTLPSLDLEDYLNRKKAMKKKKKFTRKFNCLN